MTTIFGKTEICSYVMFYFNHSHLTNAVVLNN